MALSFAKDIRTLFRDHDIESMKDYGGFDLSKYEDVKKHANDIYHRTKDGDMPCDGAWPEAKLKTLKEWIDSGMAA